MGKSHKITTFKSIGKSIGKSSINGPSFSCDYEDARISPAQLLALVFFGIQGQRALAHVAASAEVHSWDIHVRYPVLYHFQKKQTRCFFGVYVVHRKPFIPLLIAFSCQTSTPILVHIWLETQLTCLIVIQRSKMMEVAEASHGAFQSQWVTSGFL